MRADRHYGILPFLSPMLDSSVLMVYRTPSYRISLLDMRLIRLPMYDSGAAAAAAAAIAADRA